MSADIIHQAFRAVPGSTASSTEKLLTLEEAKIHLRASSSSTGEDGYITGLVDGVTRLIEDRTARALLTTQYDMFRDDFPRSTDPILVPRSPLVSVSLLQWFDDLDVAHVVSSSQYIVDAVSEPGRVALRSDYEWSTGALRAINGVQVRFVAGYGSSGSHVPERYREGARLLLGHLFENRESVGSNMNEIPLGVCALIDDDSLADEG